MELLRGTGWFARKVAIYTLLALMGLIIGVSCVIMPINIPIGIVACPIILLLWIMPELQLSAGPFAEKRLIPFIYVNICVPIYIAIIIPGVPFFSARRLFMLALVLSTVLAVCGSAGVREKFWDTLSSSPFLRFFSLGYICLIAASVIISVNRSVTISAIVQMFLLWLVPFTWCVVWGGGASNPLRFLRCLVVSAVICAIVGGVEYDLKSAFLWKILPGSTRQYLITVYPTLGLIEQGNFRDGVYRSISTFSTSLAWAQFAAMIVPVSLYFFVSGMRWPERVLGFIGLLSCLMSLYYSGSRGGYVSAIGAASVFVLVWAVRNTREKVGDFVGPTILTICSIGVVVSLLAVAFVPAVHIRVFGGGSTQSSDDARQAEWDKAKPHIWSSPVWGHGFGVANDVVQFSLVEGGGTSLDDYRINLLVDSGIAGLILYYGMVLIAIGLNIISYIYRRGRLSTAGAPLACALTAYGIYSTALSQQDNATLVFCMVGYTFWVWRSDVNEVTQSKTSVETVGHRLELIR